MMNDIDKRLTSALARYRASGIETQVDFERFYLYSLITHSTAIEGSTMTEVENQLLFDEGISPAGHTLVEQLMNVDLRDAYTKWLGRAVGLKSFTINMLREMAADVMRRTGTVYHTMMGDFDSSQGDFRLVNVRAGVSGRSYMAYQKVKERTERFCDWLNVSLSDVGADDPVAAYRLSFAAHFRLVTIHPWVDGNGRTTRLLTNVLQRHFGLPLGRIMKEQKANYITALVDAREEDDEQIFIDRMLLMLAENMEADVRQYEADTAL